MQVIFNANSKIDRTSETLQSESTKTHKQKKTDSTDSGKKNNQDRQ